MDLSERNWASGAWRFIVMGIAWLLTLFLFIRAFSAFSDLSPYLTIPMFAIMYLVIMFTVTLVHELGHAFAARLLSWNVREIAVGIIVYRPPSKTWSWSWDRNQHLEHEDYAGWVHAIPSYRRRRAGGEFLFAAGGAIASVVCGLLLVVIGTANSLEPDVENALIALGTIFFVDAVANLVPSSKGGGAKSDGMRLLELAMQRSKEADFSFHNEALYRVIASIEDGGTVASKDLVLLDEPRTSEALLDEATLMIMLSAYFKAGRLNEHKDVLLRYRDLRGGLTDPLKSDLAFAIAILDRDADKAEAILSDVQPDTKRNSIGYMRAMATIHYVAGRHDQADDTVEKLRKLSGFIADQDDEALLAAIKTRDELPDFSSEQI